MALNLTQTDLEITDPELTRAWDELQGNIVKSHGRDHARHLFIHFTGSSDQCRKWLADLAKNTTSALAQHETSRDFQSTGTEHLFTSISLSYTGYQALGIEDEKTPTDKAFRRGMRDLDSPYNTTPVGNHNPTPNPLNDSLDEWEDGFKEQIDALIVLAYGGPSTDDSTCESLLDAELAKLRESLEGIGDIKHIENGYTLRNEKSQAIEHFGYSDGVSNPLFFKPDIEKARLKGGIEKFDPSAPLGIALVPDPGGKYRTKSFGSYLVYRKLQQNIKGFHNRLKLMSRFMSVSSGHQVCPETTGAMVIGRFKDGTPISEQSGKGWTNLYNNFNFDNDSEGRQCPFSSHVRKTNPRGDTLRDKGIPLAAERSRRLVRRGMSYGSRDLDPKDEWTEAGLLFMSYQSDIEQQFIFMQNTWCNNQNFPRAGTGLDPLIGRPKDGEAVNAQTWPTQWGISGKNLEFGFSGFVRTLGGEYFFSPSISFLQNL